MTKKRQCEHKLNSGKRCLARARKEDRFCFFHSPDVVQERLKARKSGGIARSKKAAVLPDAPERPLRNCLEVCELLGEAINQVRRGELEPRVANAVGYLAGLLLKALEQGRLEERLAHLEAITGREKSDVFQFRHMEEKTFDQPPTESENN